MLGLLGIVWMFVGTFVARWGQDANPPPEETIAEELYRQYYPMLARRCWRLLRDEALVEDAMQELYLLIGTHHEQFRGEPRQMASWLLRMATRHCLRMLDKNQRWHRNLSVAMASFAERQSASVGMETRLAMESFLESLPEREREAVLYRFVSGMTQEEIAEVMDVSRDQVRRWLKHFQARGRIVFRERGGR